MKISTLPVGVQFKYAVILAAVLVLPIIFTDWYVVSRIGYGRFAKNPGLGLCA